MERRKALQAIVFFSVAGNVIISCKDKEEVYNHIKLKNITINKTNADVIDNISSLIFPSSGIPEFKNHTALPFILTMIDDCYTQEDQKIFSNGINNLNQLTQQELKKDFSQLSIEEKNTILINLNADKSENKSDVKKFYDIIKDKTLQYFTTTEYYMRNHNRYEMVPGRFLGCVKIEDLQTKKL